MCGLKLLATLLPEIFWACWAGPGFSAAWTTSGPVARNSQSVYLNSLWSSDDKSKTRTDVQCLESLHGSSWQVSQDLGVEISDFYNSHSFTPQTPTFLNSMIGLTWCHYQKDIAGWLPVSDALMCCRNEPPGQNLEEHKHVSCHARPAGRQEESILSWQE